MTNPRMEKTVNKSYITNDLSIAAFLLMKGKSILRADKSGPGGKYVFEFEDSAGDAQIIALQFLSSDCSKYDNYIRTLRGMLRSS